MLKVSLAVAMVLLVSAAAAQSPQDEAALVQQRNQVREMVRDSLSALYEVNPGARVAIERAAGYGVFSSFGVKVFFAGGGSGSGVVINNHTHRETFMKMVQVQAGLGFGARKDRLIFIFETQRALADFISQGWEFSGQAGATAMVADRGGLLAGAISISPGVYMYQLTETGLAASITLGGTKFFRDTSMH